VFSCCNGGCVNTDNDIHNCGGCGVTCTGPSPFCAGGSCGTPPCEVTGCGASSTCCDTQCCGAGQLCCDVPGPVQGPPRCTDPDNGTCPKGCPQCVCAAPDTMIATPFGEREIDGLVAGDLVYSVRGAAFVAVPLSRVQRVETHGHHVVRVELETGRVLEISPRHPTADGRTFGDLRTGDRLDGVRITSAEIVPYRFTHTIDILPASETGTYVAGGVLIGTTMSPFSSACPWRAPRCCGTG